MPRTTSSSLAPPARRALPALLLVLALVAGACSDGDGEGTSSTTAPPGPLTTGTVPVPVEVEPSPGCEGDPPAPGRRTVEVRAAGIERSYAIYVPEGLTPGRPAPLVLQFAEASPASDQERISGLSEAAADGTVPAEEWGAVVVTPEPLGGDDPRRTWNLTDQEGWADDTTFVTNLMLDVRATTCLDLSRTIVVGFGVGGSMAAQMACANANDVTLLVGVAGLEFPPECDPVRPLPILMVHGIDDPVLPIDGGGDLAPLGLGPDTTAGLADLLARRPSVRATALDWVERNDCETEPAADDVAPGANRSTWTGCNQGATVTLVSIEGAGHTWPGSQGMDDLVPALGPVADDVDANDLIWDTFQAQLPD
ncbi:MAG TPA: PHB depolymerase family esterase [Acidimicrobiales bacterium]|nr:PHB depolymerase family esterase [Acidimicrobiales bacterium]